MSGTHGTIGRIETPHPPCGRPAAGDEPGLSGRPAVVAVSRGRLLGVLACALVAAAATGCKSGAAMTKPSWWSFKGDSSSDSAKLASAPRFEGDTRKPSETAKPYPTTSTPNGYVIAGTGGQDVAAGQIQPPSPQQPVVYGQTPPPAPAAPAMTAGMAPATPVGVVGSPAQPAAQVGPYASLGGDQIPPAGQPLPNIAPLSSSPTQPGVGGYAGATPAGQPGETALPTTAYPGYSAPAAAGEPAARMADARGVPDPRAAESAAFAGAAADAAGSRYASASASRFGGPQPASAYPTAASAGGFGRPPESSAMPAMPPAMAPAMPPAGMAPATMPATPAATPALLPPSGQPAGMPTTPPARRPDPGYRPFGTSSYRPSQAILADDSPAPAPVRTVSFEDANAAVR